VSAGANGYKRYSAQRLKIPVVHLNFIFDSVKAGNSSSSSLLSSPLLPSLSLSSLPLRSTFLIPLPPLTLLLNISIGKLLDPLQFTVKEEQPYESLFSDELQKENASIISLDASGKGLQEIE
jgi:hypothetical protein